MRMAIAVLIVSSLAGCAIQPASKGTPLPGQTEADLKADIAKCKPATPGIGDVILMGGMVVVGPMMESEYSGCMRGKGYTDFPRMPRTEGPKEGH